MLLPVLLVTAGLCHCQAEVDPAVSALVSKFHHLNESSDVVGSFETLGEDSRDLIRLGQPVGELLDALNSESGTTNQTSTITEVHKLFQIPDDYNTAIARTLPDGDFEHPTWGREHVFRSMQSLTDLNRTANDQKDLLATIKKELYRMFVNPRFLQTPEFFGGFYNIHEPSRITILVKTKRLRDRERVSLEELALHYDDLRVVRTELLRLVLVKSMIGNITYPTNQSYYFLPPPEDYNEAEPTVKVLTTTGQEIADRAREVEDLAWPEIGIQIAKDAIGKEQGRDLNQTAQIVQKALQKQGSRRYTHKVLLVPTSEKNNSNATEFNIHIFRVYGNASDEIVVKVNSANQESACIFHPLFVIIMILNIVR